MSIAYFDCFAGAGGDMIVGSLLDAGADFDALVAELGKLGAEGYDLRIERVLREGLAGTKFHVDLAGPRHEHDEQAGVRQEGDPADTHHAHRNLQDILEMIDRAALAGRADERARRIFTRLAEAEAKVHDVAVDEVHFHEVGAVDSIVDIVGTCVALELLGVDRVFCSPIPIGSGTFRCAHGVMPAPAPATAELLVGVRTAPSSIAGEITTPTAAAVLTTLAESFGPMPAMDVSAVGYGAGTREDGPVPNLLRVFVGRTDEDGNADALVEISANIDDCTGEVLGAAMEKLLAAGCADVWASPIYMKKSRPAWTIMVLCEQADVARAEQILFTETTTFGLRRRPVTRSKLRREHRTVETPYGPIRIKVGLRDAEELTASAEFADCLAAAEAHHVPVKEVLAAARAAYRQGRHR